MAVRNTQGITGVNKSHNTWSAHRRPSSDVDSLALCMFKGLRGARGIILNTNAWVPARETMGQNPGGHRLASWGVLHLRQEMGRSQTSAQTSCLLYLCWCLLVFRPDLLTLSTEDSHAGLSEKTPSDSPPRNTFQALRYSYLVKLTSTISHRIPQSVNVFLKENRNSNNDYKICLLFLN